MSNERRLVINMVTSQNAYWNRRQLRVVVTILLGIHTLLLAYAADCNSPTQNEPGHLVAGISNWRFGQFDVYKVNPPLVRIIAALPVILAGAKTDWHSYTEEPIARSEFSQGEDFVAANGARSFWLFTLARWACIPFSLLGGYVCFRWANELYGSASGLLALALWCFCPNIIAHGQLLTSDAAATSLGILACFTFWQWLKQPTWWHTLVSGAVLGIAELAKTTLLIFYPLWPVLWLVYRWGDWRAPLTSSPSSARGEERLSVDDTRSVSTTANLRSAPFLHELGMLVVRMVIGIYVINLGYGFEGTGTRLGDLKFVSAALGSVDGQEKASARGGNRFADSWIGALAVPLPKNYVLGIDLQRRDFEDYKLPSYLHGKFRDKGWAYYYLYALAIKVPLGTWGLIGLAGIVGFWAKANVSWRDEFILLSPALVILSFVSSQTGFSEHMRYVLPIFPFFFVWIGRVTVVFDGRHRVLAGLVIAALIWSIGSSLSVYPHSLSYFNELAGGPTGGPKYLIHSNIDWGQDLLFLKRWLDAHPEARPIKLAYFGYFDPIHAGIEYSAPEPFPLPNQENGQNVRISPGWYAISVNFVRGLPYFAYKGDGTKTSYEQNALSQFQQLKPVAMAGYSIYIYHVEYSGSSSADQR